MKAFTPRRQKSRVRAS
ncbi:BnaC07g12400D [Brassica napus]|uniref:BnaC07g12400D protein n=1 Tax=Brassica napus TaxID=3708 RepID=A0A078G7K7_BRANA|nr:BnaC07g12400D [Brassica napus]